MHAYRAILKQGRIDFIEPIPDYDEAEICVVILNSIRKNHAAEGVAPMENTLAGCAFDHARSDPISYGAMIEWINAENEDTDWEEAFNADRG